jgi:hypothetical protein
VSERPTHRFQHTLQALIDFTGYLTTKTYAFASAMHSFPGTTPSPATTGIEEEEIRMEIKALKGLVLNRSVSLSFHTHRLIGLPNLIVHTLTHDRHRLLLQENVHSGHCSALERTNRQGPVTRRCLTFVTRAITVIVTHHVAIATCFLFENFYARGDLVSCTPSVLSYYACSSVSQKTQ